MEDYVRVNAFTGRQTGVNGPSMCGVSATFAEHARTLRGRCACCVRSCFVYDDQDRTDSSADPANPSSHAMMQQLEAKHGPLMFHQSGGCCDGSSPMCYPCGEFLGGTAMCCWACSKPEASMAAHRSTSAVRVRILCFSMSCRGLSRHSFHLSGVFVCREEVYWFDECEV